jgi:hypothetical protein
MREQKIFAMLLWWGLCCVTRKGKSEGFYWFLLWHGIGDGRMF